MYLFLLKTDSLDIAVLELWLAWPLWYTYRLTHSASELSGFTCTSSRTSNFSTAWVFAKYGIENFEFIVSESEQVNPDNLEQ